MENLHGKRIQMNENEFDREFILDLQINKLKNDEVLERLGSDYDENGIPYWESK
jgi:hypothetical protein